MFKNKYLKYKKKYSLLKNQIGGNNFYLPCEINNLTKGYYLNNDEISIIYDRLPVLPFFRFNDSLFQQDPVIMLKNHTNENLAIIVRPSDVGQMRSIDKISGNGNDFGGNFISSPQNNIYCFDNITPDLQNYFVNPIQSGSLGLNLIPLRCSFRFNSERHIDECMTFMPYAPNYKIWIYDIRSVKLSDSLLEILDDTNSDKDKEDLIIDLKEILTNTKNPKTIEAINYILGYLTGDYNDILHFNTSIEAINNRLTLKNKFCLNPNLYDDLDIDLIKHNLNLERNANIATISQTEFGGLNMDKFVFFPIDLEIDENRNYKIANIPIFNRLWIETEEECVCLFSEGIKDQYVRSKVQYEFTQIKSFITQNIPTPDFIDTRAYNEQGNVGGNLHCLIKNKYCE
jgi:hypothetical protein